MPYRAKMKFFVPALYSVMDAVLFLALIWWWRNELDPSRVIIAFTLTAIPGFLLMFLSDRGRMIRLRFVEVAEIRTLLREALPVIVAFVFLGLHDKADALLMDWLSTDKELGIYGAAFTSLAPFIGTIPFTLAMTMVPAISHLAKEDPVRSHRYSMTALRIMIVGAVILCAVASPLAPFFIDVVSKGRYANNVIHFFLFLWMPLPIFILAFTQDLMNAYSKQRDYVYVAVTLATLTVAAGLLLIPWLHALGATIAKLISVATGAAVALWLFRRILREGITLTFVTSVVVLTIVGVTASVFLPTVMSMWAAAALCGGITLATSFGLGLLRWKDLTLIRTMLGSTRRAHHS
jgi:O-antigen/teichoic acid export membrane protein